MPSADDRGRERGARRGRAQRLLQSAVHQQRRVDAVREVAQLLHRVLQVVTDLLEDLLRGVGIGVGELTRQIHVDGQRDQVLLRAVVQVALDGTALRVAGFDDARADARNSSDCRRTSSSDSCNAESSFTLCSARPT